jgi:pimeloyl-ACP methyl ester carboxylesterase
MAEGDTITAGSTQGEEDFPLAAYAGERPPAPAWFDHALAMAPERGWLEVEGARLETLAWGDVGKPGLLLCHGNSAHADWWSFIAPFFAADWRVAAFSWSGMGGSDWRETYSMDGHAREALAVAEHLGLFENAQKPVFVGHSFGGTPVTRAAELWGGRLRLAVVVDSGARIGATPPKWRERTRPNAVYPTLEAALARYRLPNLTTDNPFILDYLARRAAVRAPGDASGWTWAFDPFMGQKRDVEHVYRIAEMIGQARCPLAFIWGDRSHLITPEMIANTQAHSLPGTRYLEIPEAGHFVMVDQPLALVAGLKGLLA